MTEHVWSPLPNAHVCVVCGQRRGNHETSCPRTRDWKIAAVEHETIIGNSVWYKRAYRIDIDRCEGCPFSAMSIRACVHPGLRHVHNVIAIGEPPRWCPLRQKVTLVAGPRNEPDS